MTTIEHLPALRLALQQMLNDPTYPVALRSPWIADRLAQEEPWDADQLAILMVRAKAWAQTQGGAKDAILRALGEEIDRDPVGGAAPAPISQPGPTRGGAEAGTSRKHKERVAQMNTIAEDKLSAIIEKMQVAPYWFPQDTKRLDAAVKLYREGKVILDEYGVFHVASRSKDKMVYDIGKNECPCEDGQRREKTKWCAHLISTVVYRKMHAPLDDVQPILFAPQPTIDERLAKEVGSMPAPKDEEFIPEPVIPALPSQVSLTFPEQCQVTHTGAVMYEAPYSATVSVENDQGYGMLLTVRKQNNKEFFEAISALLAWCANHGLHPQRRAIRSTPAPSVSPTETPQPASDPEEDDTKPCPLHAGFKLKKQTNAKGTWWSHRTDEGWCHGTQRRVS